MFSFDARLTALSSPDLLAALERTAAHGREITADLIALLAECDTRQLYATEGYASLFDFCVVRLRLSEAQTSCVSSTAERRDACPTPGQDARPAPECSLWSVAPAPTVGDSPAVSPPAARSEIRPLAPERYSLHMTISQETHDKLRRAQDLLRHALPNTDPALVLDRALTVLLAQLERRKAGAPDTARRLPRSRATEKTASVRASGSTARPGSGTVPPHAFDPPIPAAVRAHTHDSTTPPGRATRDASTSRRSRYIPAAIRRAVWDRDGARCAYVSSTGMRCTAAGLEFHHRIPFAEGGACTVDNVAVTCALHNALEARRWFNSNQAEFGLAESRV